MCVLLSVGKKREEENNLLRQHVHMYASAWTPMSMPCVGQLFPPTVPSKLPEKNGDYLQALSERRGTRNRDASLRNYLESRQRGSDAANTNQHKAKTVPYSTLRNLIPVGCKKDI